MTKKEKKQNSGTADSSESKFSTIIEDTISGVFELIVWYFSVSFRLIFKPSEIITTHLSTSSSALSRPYTYMALSVSICVLCLNVSSFLEDKRMNFTQSDLLSFAINNVTSISESGPLELILPTLILTYFFGFVLDKIFSTPQRVIIRITCYLSGISSLLLGAFYLVSPLIFYNYYGRNGLFISISLLSMIAVIIIPTRIICAFMVLGNKRDMFSSPLSKLFRFPIALGFSLLLFMVILTGLFAQEFIKERKNGVYSKSLEHSFCSDGRVKLKLLLINKNVRDLLLYRTGWSLTGMYVPEDRSFYYGPYHSEPVVLGLESLTIDWGKNNDPFLRLEPDEPIWISIEAKLLSSNSDNAKVGSFSNRQAYKRLLLTLKMRDLQGVMHDTEFTIQK